MKNFIKVCNQMIDEIQLIHPLDANQIILWIYFNIYLYDDASITQRDESRSMFLEALGGISEFSCYEAVYEAIPQLLYDKLQSSILENYIHEKMDGNNEKKGLSLKALEIIYEESVKEPIREDTGTYYTPEVIVQHMVLEAICAYLKKEHPQLKLDQILREMIINESCPLADEEAQVLLDSLDQIKVIDIACGGGVFLRQALETLYQLKSILYKRRQEKRDAYTLKKQILQKQIYGVEIQQDTVTLCRLLLLMELGKSHCGSSQKLTTLQITEGDALRLDLPEASFDIVIGNPPYLGERGNKALFHEMKLFDFGKKYYERNMDYFYFFIYKGYELLKPGGFLSFITTNYFVTADGAMKLREFLRGHFTFKYIVNYNELSLFHSAKGQHNMNFLVKKESKTHESMVLISFNQRKIEEASMRDALLYKKKIEGVSQLSLADQEEIYDQRGQILIQSTGEALHILKEIENKANYSLGDLCHVNQGIVSGADRLTKPWAHKLGIEEQAGGGIFVLTQEEIEALRLEEEVKSKYIQPFYKNSHVKPYRPLFHQFLSILYITDDNLAEIEKYPKLCQHLMGYRPLLQRRREVEKGLRRWYALQWPRSPQIFQGEKIIAPQRATMNTFAYVDGPYHASADIYYITSKDESCSLFYLLGILNSSLMFYWLFYRGKRKGEMLELYATPLKSLPIYYGSKEDVRAIERMTKSIYLQKDQGNDTGDIEAALDDLIFELYGCSIVEKQLIINWMDRRRKKA
ncbi:hypothetical protein Amet_3064 [Alkaliphilus metalliredigens QYMF]|uniref:site-specific DNA-methyltransferase (adenine-specific) n=1 Tax=Alkaliphilus metalliredigens (strain QYMF) TaxID=293826 RepID=A6TSN6_ALKMQ|nr:N-6 DNA methylase [Alkaliphilus metalliredigens]ABR49204.1 hypothetical protein Amet_3064 [Alkaliphilus metalliredigens QYMF]